MLSNPERDSTLFSKMLSKTVIRLAKPVREAAKQDIEIAIHTGDTVLGYSKQGPARIKSMSTLSHMTRSISFQWIETQPLLAHKQAPFSCTNMFRESPR